MNDGLASTRSTAAPFEGDGRPTFWQKALLAAFERFDQGGLHIRLPDGSVRTIGEAGRGVTATIDIHDPDFFRRCVLFGDIGFAEAYLDGLWDTDSIERVIAWAIAQRGGGRGNAARQFNFLRLVNRLGHAFRRNSVAMSRRNISAHYDLGNAFYRLWLDPTMSYSGAYFTSANDSLEDAQAAKYDRLCRSLRLGPGDQVLEIGCGWGGFCEHAARHYGCRIVAVTISAEQHRYAVERMARAGLADRVEVRLQDYRQIEGRFDKIVSIEMMEALGDRYLPVFCRQVSRLLAPDGLAGFQYITVPDSAHAALRRDVDFIQKHIFPGSLLLSVGRVGECFTQAGDLFLHDLKDIGSSYARTLREWWLAFNRQEEAVRALGFGTRFVRKWNYYLQYCEAAFATRNISVVQAVYTRPNNPRLA